jgi:hypothetical protein
MTAAKRQPAIETTVILQNLVIEDLPEFCSSETASRCTDQPAENGPGHTSSSDANGPASEPDNSANFSPSHCAFCSLGSTTDGADESAELSGEILGDYSD